MWEGWYCPTRIETHLCGAILVAKVLVTGASGFIGCRVVSGLLEKGWHVLPVSLSGRGGLSLDLKNTEAVRRFLKRECPDHLIHLAWNVNAGYMESIENLEWVTASLELLKAFAENGGQRAIFAGSCIEYDWRYGFMSEELTPLAQGSLYGIAKNALHDVAAAYAARQGVSFAWGRVFFLYGDGEKRERLVPSLIDAFLHGRTPELRCPDVRRDYLHVDDVAAAFVAILKGQFEGAVNIASGEAISLGAIGRKIAGILRCAPPEWQSKTEQQAPSLVLGDTRRLNDIIRFKPTTTWDVGLTAMIEKERRTMLP